MGGGFLTMLDTYLKHVRPGTALWKDVSLALDCSVSIHAAIGKNLAAVCRGQWLGAYDSFCEDVREARAWSDGTAQVHFVLDGGCPDLKGAPQQRRDAAQTGLMRINEATVKELNGARPVPCGATDVCTCTQCAAVSDWDVRHAKFVRPSKCTEGLKSHLAAVAHRKSIEFMPCAIRALRCMGVNHLVAPMESDDQILFTKAGAACGHDCDFTVKQRKPNTRIIILCKGGCSGNEVQRCIKLLDLKPGNELVVTKSAKSDPALDALIKKHGRGALRRVAKLSKNDYNVGPMPVGFGMTTAVRAAVESYAVEGRNSDFTECQAMVQAVANVMPTKDVDVTEVNETLEMVTLLCDHHAVCNVESGAVQMAAPFTDNTFHCFTEEEAHAVTGVSRYQGTKHAASDAVDYDAFSKGELDPRTHLPWDASLLPAGGLGSLDAGGEPDDVALRFRDGSNVPEEDEVPADLDRWTLKKSIAWLKARGFTGLPCLNAQESRNAVQYAYEMRARAAAQRI